MPTKRTRRGHNRIEFSDAMQMHIEDGDCLLAGPGRGCGCGLVGPDGVLRDDLVREMARYGEVKTKEIEVPTKRSRARRVQIPEIAPALLRWLAGTGAIPVVGYFLTDAEIAELRVIHKGAIAAERSKDEHDES